jgi:hypothetical protein
MAIRYGVDFAGAWPAVDAMRRAGRDFVVRYVSRPGAAKNITTAEARHWQENGIDVAVVFETTAGRALSGTAAGSVDAASARDQVVAAGGPADGGVIYFAVDVDTTTAGQRDIVAGYLRGAAGVLGWDQVGVYGEYEVVDHVSAHTPCRWYWQTYAWSGGKGPHPRAQLYQYRNGQLLGGVEVDFDQALADDFGQWGKERGMSLTTDEHNWLFAVYRQVTGAVGRGQLDFQGTIKAVLGTVQGLVNLSRSNTSALGRTINASEQTILAAIAALPTTHLSAAEQHQVADAAVDALAEHGVQIDDTALLDALSIRLDPEPSPEQGTEHGSGPAEDTEPAEQSA